MSKSEAPALEVEDLNVWYATDRGRAHVVRAVSLTLRSGEIVGVIGESGCGKSTLARAILRLLPENGRIGSGRVVVGGKDVIQLREKELRQIRGRTIAMIFQDPSATLNPSFRLSTQMVDVALAHGGGRRTEILTRAIAMLERVGIGNARERVRSFPFEFSGGMQQRVAVAMALMLHPTVLLADEPTSALDVTLQAQVIDLIGELAHESQTAVLLVSHDFQVVRRICDRVVVMYAGRVAEEGTVEEVCGMPMHPYTQALLKSRASVGQRGHRLAVIPGGVPDLTDTRPGCEFVGRCASAMRVCEMVDPALIRTERGSVRCHLYDNVKYHDREVIEQIRKKSDSRW